MSDTELLGALRRGDEAAFEALCARYESALRRYARHVLRARPAVVDDVVQEALLRAHRALRRDDRHIEVRPYLFRLVRNCCLDELARVRTDSVPLHLLVAGEEPASRDLSVESSAEQRDRVASTLGDLAELPELQRHALVRRELDGLTHEQVAEELGITPGASRSLVYRAREALTRADAAREARCEDVRFALLKAHDEKRRAPVSALKHVAGCGGCRAFRTDLKHNRSTLRALAPGSLFVLGVAVPAVKAALAKPVATGAVALVAAGGAAYELQQHVFGPGDATPIPLSGVALPGGRLATGAPLPARTALVTARARASATTARLTCPAPMRVAGLVPVPGSQRSLGFSPRTVVGASTAARVLFPAGAEPVDLAILCRIPSPNGSVRASSGAAVAASHHLIIHACRRRTTLATAPTGPASGTITASEPLAILSGRSGWLRVRTDTGRRGWIRASVAC